MIHPNDRFGLLAVCAATVIGFILMVGGSSLAPPEGPALSHHTRALGFSSIAEDTLLLVLENEFGSHAQPAVPEAWAELFPGGSHATTAEGLAAGRRSYQSNCLHCHGHQGTARTQTAQILLPRPRDFSLGLVKFKSTPGTHPPLREDLQRTLEFGIASTAMADFAHLPQQERDELVDYVQYLLMRGAVESRVATALHTLGVLDGEPDSTEAEFHILRAVELAKTAIADEWRNAEAMKLTDSPEPESAESIARGAELYSATRAGCALCHGSDGKGKGLALWDAEAGWLLQDVWGNPVRPSDFHYGAFHAGSSPEQVYRSIAHGINGSPMGAYSTTLTHQELSDLTHYVRSLSR